MTQADGGSELSRRDFVRAAGVASLAVATGACASAPLAAGVDPGAGDTIRIGLIGCGGRGSGAARNCIASSEGVEIVAMGDLFEDRATGSLAAMQKDLPAEKVKVTADTIFWGFDAFEKVLATNCNLVILATPPHFRPQHLRAAVEAGKNIFMEKPVAVDPVGIRSVIESGEMAKAQGLGIVAGTQRRHQAHYIEIMKRIQDGAIGDIVAAQCFWNMGGLWVHEPRPEWSDMEWQCRNWLYFTWLSGDHIVEQHVHNLDVVAWAIGETPLNIMGMGGRQVRTEPKFGNIFDHFALELEYGAGARVLSMCRQTPGCASRVSERIVGTKGQVYTDSSNGWIEGENAYKYEGPTSDPYVQEHADLIASVRAGEPLNEARQVAESTLMAISGRMSAYTGRALKYDWAMKSSKLDLTPPKYEMGDLPVAPVAVPGKTQLI